MNEQAIYGKSYWEIVVHAFRKNWVARGALWISGTMILIAALTPLLANDRPYFFHGTMPGEYRRSYNGIVRGAYRQIETLPARLRTEIEKFERRTVSQLELLRRMNEEETRLIYGTLKRLEKWANSIPAIRGRWTTRDVTLEEMLAEMTLEERTPFERARERILKDLPSVYQAQLDDTVVRFGRKLRELADQLEPHMSAKARSSEQSLRKVTAAGFLTTHKSRTTGLQELLASIQTDFDPDKVTQIPQVRFPLINSLNGLDIFLILATLLAIVAFGPLTWCRLKRIAPLERRWWITWTLTLAPALLSGVAWETVHNVKFETVSYKRGIEDGSVVMTSALWPPIRYRYDEVPETQGTERPPHPPGPGHPLGTDFMGRDLLSRMLWGSRISLSIGFVSATIALTIGVVLGALAGFFRGLADILLSRLIEIMICFPSFFIILAVVAFLPPNIFFVMLALGIFGWMGIARLQRGEFLRLVNQDFVTAAQALGASQFRIIFRHILPNALAPILVAASFGIAGAMLTESGLSYLGFGVQEPQTSWGQILFTGRGQLDKWWTFVIPGAAIFIAVTCYNLVGDGIRDAVDPRLKT